MKKVDYIFDIVSRLQKQLVRYNYIFVKIVKKHVHEMTEIKILTIVIPAWYKHGCLNCFLCFLFTFLFPRNYLWNEQINQNALFHLWKLLTFPDKIAFNLSYSIVLYSCVCDARGTWRDALDIFNSVVHRLQLSLWAHGSHSREVFVLNFMT